MINFIHKILYIIHILVTFKMDNKFFNAPQRESIYMRFSVQYQASTEEWAIFDNGGSSGLVMICRTEEEALIEVLKLQEKIRVNEYSPYDDSQQIA